LLTGRLGTKNDGVLGYVGPKFMELIQAGHHFIKGRYLAYSSPHETRMGRTMLIFSIFDKGIRKIAGRFFKKCLVKPWSLFRRMHYQSVMIIQPVDFLENGAQNMCDGCPDVTVWDNQIVWSCRLEELKNFGVFVRSVPKNNSEN